MFYIVVLGIVLFDTMALGVPYDLKAENVEYTSEEREHMMVRDLSLFLICFFWWLYSRRDAALVRLVFSVLLLQVTVSRLQIFTPSFTYAGT